MAKQPETIFKERVVRILKEQLPEVFHIKIQQVALVGDPDLVLCAYGTFVAWELKVKKNRASKIQKYKLDEVTKAGGIARTVYPSNLDECLEELRCLKRS